MFYVVRFRDQRTRGREIEFLGFLYRFEFLHTIFTSYGFFKSGTP